jgi:tryptophanyl-tRNA synthetase
MKIRYGDMKKQLAEDMIAFTAPLRERIQELSKDEDYIHKVATEGAAKARESAGKTISEARKLIGFRSF